MARDFRYPQMGDRNKYYKAVYVNQNKLTSDAECQGVFYSVDFEPMSVISEWLNGTQHKTKRIKIKTNDYVVDLEIDDYVMYNGDLWLVESLEVADIVDNAKPYQKHSNETIIGLRR